MAAAADFSSGLPAGNIFHSGQVSSESGFTIQDNSDQSHEGNSRVLPRCPVLTENVGTMTRITLFLAAAFLPVFTATSNRPRRARRGAPENELSSVSALQMRKRFSVNGIQGAKMPMEKSDDGSLDGDNEPLQPDFYAYTYAVDGVRTIDPSNSTKSSLIAQF